GQDLLPPIADDGFGRVAVRQSRLAVACKLRAELIEQTRSEGRVERDGDGICSYQTIAAVFLRIGCAAVFQVRAGEVLAIVTKIETVGRIELQVHFAEIYILIELPYVVNGQRQESISTRDGCRIGRIGIRKWVDDVGLRVALPVIVEEEEGAFFFDRTTEVAAELMEMIGRFIAATDDGVRRVTEPETVRDERGPSARKVFQTCVIAQAVGIERSIAEKVEGRSVEFICSGLGDHINCATGGPPELGGETVGIDLELLYGVLAELIRRAA